MNRQTRQVEFGGSIPADTFTGNRALDIEQALIFEIGRPEVTGVDLGTPADFEDQRLFDPQRAIAREGRGRDG